jgi:hypothetical protein
MNRGATFPGGIMSIGEQKAKVKAKEKKQRLVLKRTGIQIDSIQIDGVRLPLGYRAGEKSVVRTALTSARFNEDQRTCTLELIT